MSRFFLQIPPLRSPLTALLFCRSRSFCRSRPFYLHRLYLLHLSSTSHSPSRPSCLPPPFPVCLSEPRVFCSLVSCPLSRAACCTVHIPYPNPDRYAPSAPAGSVVDLTLLFGELRQMSEGGTLAYPYSTRELVKLAQHLERFPDDGIDGACANVIAPASYNELPCNPRVNIPTPPVNRPPTSHSTSTLHLHATSHHPTHPTRL